MKLTICLDTLRLGLVLHADILPRHQPYVGHLKSMYCPSICCPAGSRGTSMVPWGGVNAGWKPSGSRIGETSSLLSDDSAASSSEDMSTTVGSREVTCMRRAYANSLQIGVASMIQPFRPFCSTCGGGLPNTIRVFSSGVRDAKVTMFLQKRKSTRYIRRETISGSIRGHNHLMDVVASLSRDSKIGPVRVNHKVSTTGDGTRKKGDVEISNFPISPWDGLVIDVFFVYEFKGSSRAPGEWNTVCSILVTSYRPVPTSRTTNTRTFMGSSQGVCTCHRRYVWSDPR